MNLNAITIRGYKFYFYSELTQADCLRIEEFCVKLSTKCSLNNPEEIYQKLTRYISSEIGVNVESAHLQHIFRIN